MADISHTAVLTRWWRGQVIGSVDHVEVLDRVHDEAGWNARYLFMTTMSAGIAVLGLLLSSPAVVIGAMLISPLMGPIIGLGFALATVDARYIRRSAGSLAAGSMFAILFCALIVLLSPLQNVTSEIAARTRPNLFDLLVALFSALAGAYATIKGRAGTIVGVAIATALMPPLATVGFGLATLNATVFGGALLLFVTNFVTIAITAAVMARLYGFASNLSPNQTLWQSAAILVTFLVLAIPLGISLRQIAWENLAGRQARTAVSSAFPRDARISQIDLDFNQRPIGVSATVLTPAYRQNANVAAAEEFARLVGTEARVRIVQYRVGTADAEATELQKAKADTPAIDPAVTRLADQLAFAAGVDADQLLIDGEHRRALVRANPLPGADVPTYRALEERVATNARGWRVELVPPVALTLRDDTAAADAAWLAARRGEAVEVSGSDTADLRTTLEKAGAQVTTGSDRGPTRLRLVPPPLVPPPVVPTVKPSPAPSR